MTSPYPPIPPDPRDPSSAQVAAMSLPELLDATNALRNDVQTSEKARRLSDDLRRKQLVQLRRDGRIMLALTALLLLVLGGTLVGAYRLYDCTSPSGGCYKQGAARTGAIVTDLITGQVYIVECARLFPGEVGPAFDAKFEQCVVDRQRQVRTGKRPLPGVPASPIPAPTPPPPSRPPGR